MSAEWYLNRNNQNFGPYTWEQLSEFTRQGQINGEDLLWSPPLGEWRKAASVAGLPLQGAPPLQTLADTSPHTVPQSAPGKKGFTLSWKTGGLALAAILILTGLIGGTAAALKALSFVFTGLFLFAVVRTALSFQQWRQIRPRTLYIAAATAPLALLIYLLLLQAGAGRSLFLLLAIGAAAGIFWGRTTRVAVEEGGIYSQGTLWGFLIWAGLVALLQLANLLFNVNPQSLVLLLALQTGVMALYNFTLALRCRGPLKEVNA